MNRLWLPDDWGARAIVVRDGAFLIVEEETRSGVRLNQPAGHLEAGETLVAAAMRETLEETGYRVTPTALVGIYRWQAPETGATFIRFAFAGDRACKVERVDVLVFLGRIFRELDRAIRAVIEPVGMLGDVGMIG